MPDLSVYQAILDSIHHRIVFVDNDHIIRFLNRKARRWFYEKRGHADLIGKSIFACHQPASCAQLKRLYHRLQQGEDEVFVKITAQKEKASMVAVRDAHGRLLGYFERFESLAPEIPPGATAA
ncbi:hypothetical protein DSCA_17090 [Desulfosarcina alkanivorans]|uniref:PAS domain-containing protein n=1 Tax=Desulfosarcina alkanivorans TaxID=571177 RepID=A0A5K7YIT0_9BACT|nr:PAS domain-containing protein [Desulfosarcina alkanivorans]BBO67779.1 hypothetical protein DSCA_17090 [Desulfosarcina alkanivorans]